MTYKLPSGLASFDPLPTEEWTLPGRAADRNKALREALKECHRLQSERDALVSALTPLFEHGEWYSSAIELDPHADGMELFDKIAPLVGVEL